MELEQTELVDYRRQALLASMHEVSEDCWGSGWFPALSRDLYRIAFERASPEYGMGWVNAEERKKLRKWAILTDTWFIWDRATQMPMRISLETARDKFQRIISKSAPGGLRVREALALYQGSKPSDWMLERFEAKVESGSRLTQWLSWAREVYRLRHDPALYLARRRDSQLTLGYGTCQLDVVQPAWLPDSVLRAAGCTDDKPCQHFHSCPACAQTGAF